LEYLKILLQGEKIEGSWLWVEESERAREYP
jgi:hypothetical protein